MGLTITPVIDIADYEDGGRFTQVPGREKEQQEYEHGEEDGECHQQNSGDDRGYAPGGIRRMIHSPVIGENR
jgi:hypothetical protein